MNNFTGEIPQKFDLTWKLQVLDLSSNNWCDTEERKGPDF
jgi:hypothetical protein